MMADGDVKDDDDDDDWSPWGKYVAVLFWDAFFVNDSQGADLDKLVWESTCCSFSRCTTRPSSPLE
jgi:hypothetical protein